MSRMVQEKSTKASTSEMQAWINAHRDDLVDMVQQQIAIFSSTLTRISAATSPIEFFIMETDYDGRKPNVERCGIVFKCKRQQGRCELLKTRVALDEDRYQETKEYLREQVSNTLQAFGGRVINEMKSNVADTVADEIIQRAMKSVRENLANTDIPSDIIEFHGHDIVLTRDNITFHTSKNSVNASSWLAYSGIRKAAWDTCEKFLISGEDTDEDGKELPPISATDLIEDILDEIGESESDKFMTYATSDIENSLVMSSTGQLPACFPIFGNKETKSLEHQKALGRYIIELYQERELGPLTRDDRIERQPKNKTEIPVTATVFATGDIIYELMTKDITGVVKRDDNESWHTEIVRNELPSIVSRPRNYENAIKYAEKALTKLGRKGLSVTRNTGKGLISGKGDFTFTKKDNKQGMRSTLNCSPYDKDYTAWKSGIDKYIAEAISAFDSFIDAHSISETEESLEYIHSFVERDIADIVNHVPYMALESLAPYLSGNRYYSDYDMYNPDEYEGKYKDFFTEKEISDIAHAMDRRDIVRVRYVSYSGHEYTRINSLKASRKADILTEKRYKFDAKALEDKCRQSDNMSDFESEYLFWQLEEKAFYGELAGKGGRRKKGNPKDNLEMPDYMMLVKMLKCPGFIAEYRERYLKIMKSAPEILATLLEREQSENGKTGMRDIIGKVIKQLGGTSKTTKSNTGKSAASDVNTKGREVKSKSAAPVSSRLDKEETINSADSSMKQNKIETPQKEKEHYKAITSSSLSTSRDTRYVIINEDTGEVVDDAQGYGYKTAQKAYAAWRYKNRSPEQKTKENKIQQWLKKNKELSNYLEDCAFYAWKDREEMTSKDVQEVLDSFAKDGKLNGNIPGTASEIFRVWKRL